jgi:D-Tyr-tRNAtyr deacylase
MPSEDELEATGLAQVEADLGQIVAHVTTWISDRFLAQAAPERLNLEDVAGLILWLQQWHLHFESYQGTASSLEAAGRPAMRERLAAIDAQIDASIASFTEMISTPPEDAAD